MSKKSVTKKRRLAKMAKRNRRMPALAMIRTHRRLQSNIYARNWRSRKLKIRD
ncbi:MAG: hypothetical protein QXR58_00890 [Candidatus Micrarchaeaceae archaeon]